MISIVTGTLNRRNLLPELIKNTVDSSDKLELVLVDGGSIDGSIEFIKNLHHPQIKLIEIGKRSPYPHYMNIGIKNSKYEYVCQWNDDVLLLVPWENVFLELSKEKDVYIFKWIRQNGRPLDKEFFLKEKEGVCASHVVNYGIYRKKVFREIGMYNNAFWYYHADWDMTLRATLFGYKIKLCDNIKVLDLSCPKRALLAPDRKGERLITKFRSQYQNKEIPETVEKLK